MVQLSYLVKVHVMSNFCMIYVATLYAYIHACQIQKWKENSMKKDVAIHKNHKNLKCEFLHVGVLSRVIYRIAGKFGRVKVWQIDSFQTFGERKFGELIDQPKGY